MVFIFYWIIIMTIKNWTKEWNEAMLEMEEEMMRDPKQKEKDKARREKYEMQAEATFQKKT